MEWYTDAIKRAASVAVMTSDASGCWGCGATLVHAKVGGSHFGMQYHSEGGVPIVIMAALWGPTWRGKNVLQWNPAF